MSRLDELTPGQAQFVLSRIVEDKKIRTRDIDRYLKEMDREIRSLEQRLASLRQARPGAAGGTGAQPRRRRRGRKARKAAPRKEGTRKRATRKAKTPEAQRSRQLQGQYISLIKRFSGREKEKFQKMAKDKGREEAVRQMRSAVAK